MDRDSAIALGLIAGLQSFNRADTRAGTLEMDDQGQIILRTTAGSVVPVPPGVIDPSMLTTE
jgi:hypothetical protein